MDGRPRTLVVAPLLAIIAGGCAAPTPMITTQPPRTIDEIYALQERVNRAVDPVALGTGDPIGAYSHAVDRMRSRTVTAAVVP